MNNVNMGSRTDKHGEPDASQPCLKPVGKVGIDQREKDDSWRVLDLGNHAIELGRCAHQRIDMLDRSDPLILRSSSARSGDQRFAGRVRNQMKMEIAAAQRGPQRSIATGYNQRRGMWTGVENRTAQPRREPPQPGDVVSTIHSRPRSGRILTPRRRSI